MNISSVAEFVSPSRVNALSTLKETIVNLERELVDIRLGFEKTVTCEEISDLKDKIKQFEVSMKTQKQHYEAEINTLYEENNVLKKDLEETTKSCKKLQEQTKSQTQQIKSLQTKISLAEEKQTDLTTQMQTLKQQTEALTNDSDSSSSSDSDSSDDEDDDNKKIETDDGKRHPSKRSQQQAVQTTKNNTPELPNSHNHDQQQESSRERQPRQKQFLTPQNVNRYNSKNS